MSIDNKILAGLDEYVRNRYTGNAELERLIHTHGEKIVDNFNVISFEYSMIEDIPDLGKEISWRKAVFDIIDEKNLDEVKIYKKANMNRQTFHRMKSNDSYQPSKVTAILMCLALEVDIDDALFLMEKAGYTFSDSILRDVYVSYFIKNGIYDLDEINEILYDRGIPILENKKTA